MRDISLDCLTLPDVTPSELIGIAAQATYRHVSLWVQEPALYEPMLAVPSMKREILAAIADCDITIGNLEVFNLNIHGPVTDYAQTLAFGASLGARTATAINFGEPRPDIAERLAAFDEMCAKLGLKALIEPICMGLTRTLSDGVRLIDEAGIDAQLVVDILHVMRTGGGPETLAAIRPERIAHVQICDGPLSMATDQVGRESVAERRYPGEGRFPLAEFVKLIPPHATVGVEIPCLSRQARGFSPLQRAKEIMAAVRGIPGFG